MTALSEGLPRLDLDSIDTLTSIKVEPERAFVC